MLRPIIGDHPAIVRLRRQLPEWAAREETLVIFGESGVGKTLLAEHLHALSPLKTRPLRTVNLRLLNDRDQRLQLLGGDSPELATRRRSVLNIRTTVVIKHVDAANSYLQNTLASILLSRGNSGEETSERPVRRCRLYLLLRSSPADLHRAHTLSDPLFAAIRSYPRVQLPPLRNRAGDIPALVSHYAGSEVSAQVIKLMQQLPWEENIQSLRAFLSLLSAVSPEGAAFEHERKELEKIILMVEDRREFSLQKSVDLIMGYIINRTLRGSDGCQNDAARMLGMSERSLRRQIRNGIDC